MATSEDRAKIIAAFQKMVDGSREGRAACRKIIEGMDASALLALAETPGADPGKEFHAATGDLRAELLSTAMEFEAIERVALEGIAVATEPS